MAAIALLGKGLADLRAAVAHLAQQYDALHARLPPPRRSTPDTPAGPVRWDQLDRAAASMTWVWLITWVARLTDRYQLAEELPPCWPQHPPLVEELTALCSAWHTAYHAGADPDAPLRWHEAFSRARLRLRDWDEHTRCRHGTHTDRRIDLPWPDSWRSDALDVAEADVKTRPPADHQDGEPP